jgi:hypothetical protein
LKGVVVKITFDFGRKSQHGIREQNKLLLVTVESLAKQLSETREELAMARGQLRDALSDRVVKGHQMRQGLRVVQGGQARFQLESR